MSFTKTISTVAALASIFGAAAAGWKLAESNSHQPPTVLDQKLNELDQKLEDLSESKQVVIPEPTAQSSLSQSESKPVTISPPPPPPTPDEQISNGTN